MTCEFCKCDVCGRSAGAATEDVDEVKEAVDDLRERVAALEAMIFRPPPIDTGVKP